MHTSLWPAHGMVKLGTTFGLIAAAVCPTHIERSRETDKQFGGHGLIPNLVYVTHSLYSRDECNKAKADIQPRHGQTPPSGPSR
jgi:hypothetical protein